MNFKQNFSRDLVIGIVGGTITGLSLIAMDILLGSRDISQIGKVESGFVDPSKLEVKLDDINRNGKNETHLVYDGIDYLLELSEEGKPMIVEYSFVESVHQKPSDKKEEYEIKLREIPQERKWNTK